ncbi:Aste57867_3800 [Aphanomyces stellatus]|uniref:Aste57867_3800 protein n=1 Tax=Aphanomyces stellatus TaxID=120398 RepID=A0A485KAC6_9STRA|nr:hypothetical protein As57867_003789 [Aphanomyces stellatus]VFT80949.1 Aste57867_3800 [Aphanomyces stellatus]
MATAQSRERRRRSEALRQRRVRVEKKVEQSLLQAEIQHLQEELARMIHPKRGATCDSSFDRATDVLVAFSRSLRAECATQHQLARALVAWVASHTPQPGLAPRPSWMDSTLLDDPLARRHGYQWLSERVYNNAASVFAQPSSCDSAVEDAIQFVVHTGKDSDGRLSIAAFESQDQHTFFYNYKDVAHALWSCIEQNSFVEMTIVSGSEVRWLLVVDTVSDRLVYHCGFNHGTRTNVRRLQCLFESPERIVMAYNFLAHDERFPLAPGELRSPGYGWTIFERVTDSITFVRHATLHYAPLTTTGVASLEAIGRLFGQSGVDHCEAYIERIRSIAERTAVHGFESVNRKFEALLDARYGHTMD